MLTSMIHETFHLIIGVKKEERFYYKENGQIKSKLTSGGFILDEGLVDKIACDFSKRHDLYFLPAFYYINFVKLCDSIEERLENDFIRSAFNDTYDVILNKAMTNEEIELYKMHETKKYFEKYGIDNSEILYTDSIELDESKQIL